MIGLINYGSGNIRSVSKALEREGGSVRFVSTPDEFSEISAVVLPGVGAFGDCARNLRERNLWKPLQDWISADKPFLGICVGYQLLFDSSEESPEERGFGFFPGRVKRFTSPGLKVPQIGWNNLEFGDAANPANRDHPLWDGLPADPFVYFVHSFFPETDDDAAVIARTTYGETFVSAAARGNITGVQFHPEKSQENGLRILKNFITNFANSEPKL